MKTLPEVLAEIEKQIEGYKLIEPKYSIGGTAILILDNIKQFILSGECEHEWGLLREGYFPAFESPKIKEMCGKCGVTR